MNGSRLKELRELRGMSQVDLERETGVKRVHISKLENNDSNPTLTTLQKLAVGLKTTVADIIGETLPSTKEISQELQEIRRELLTAKAETCIYRSIIDQVAAVVGSYEVWGENVSLAKKELEKALKRQQ